MTSVAQSTVQSEQNINPIESINSAHAWINNWQSKPDFESEKQISKDGIITIDFTKVRFGGGSLFFAEAKILELIKNAIQEAGPVSKHDSEYLQSKPIMNTMSDDCFGLLIDSKQVNAGNLEQEMSKVMTRLSIDWELFYRKTSKKLKANKPLSNWEEAQKRYYETSELFALFTIEVNQESSEKKNFVHLRNHFASREKAEMAGKDLLEYNSNVISYRVEDVSQKYFLLKVRGHVGDSFGLANVGHFASEVEAFEKVQELYENGLGGLLVTQHSVENIKTGWFNGCKQAAYWYDKSNELAGVQSAFLPVRVAVTDGD